MNSEPNVDASTVFCAFEYQIIDAQFKYMRIPMWEQQVTLLPAWSASTKAFFAQDSL